MTQIKRTWLSHSLTLIACASLFALNLSMRLNAADGIAECEPDQMVTFKHPELGFSMEYPCRLSPVVFADSVVLKDNKDRTEFPREIIVITANALPKIFQSQYRCGDDCIDLLLESPIGSDIQIDTTGPKYRKTANMRINGHPASKVVYESAALRHALEGTGSARSVKENIQVVMIVTKINGASWSLACLASDAVQQEARVRVFNRVIRTFRFD